ncbi:hypothetical protein ASD77_10260 [Pseudoxanthomonas sp. Root65]|uniref:hypothetical protein n=1 Tax=Pseudoxanthomonas sp. Root65 TaxID=1736576 RepID=UPI0006FA0332|nr:hypothetical protein [Pseudoxanthomonas sp. Root65]KRA54934.1 hypothetical protein ASD77_10260 [Pseudoxanthomonas sp. Root65]
MTNPHPINETDIDIRAAADRVIEHLQQGRGAEALRMLEQERAGERLVVQEALDRYVAGGASVELDRMGGQQAPEMAYVLERLQQSTRPPRMPEYNGRDATAPNELVGLTQDQRFDVYASMVEVRGNRDAFDALRNGDSVILGLRKETSTVAAMDDPRIPGAHERELRRGTGVYDDHIVVLRKDMDGNRHWFIADRANTEPTAQYDAHARPAPGREDTVYANVQWRRPQGERANNDAIPDLGRMAEGSFEMLRSTHPARGNANDFSLRPTPEQSSAPRNADLVQRDTNGDGWFTQDDIDGIRRLNNSFKIHAGSPHNTDSAGCQTIHPGEYPEFISAVLGNPQQTRWQYVLTSTDGGLLHAVGREDGQRIEQPQPAADGLQETRADDHAVGHRADAGALPHSVADRYLAAVMSGDSAAADRAATEFARSAEGREMEAQGERWLAQHQASEHATSQDRQMVR